MKEMKEININRAGVEELQLLIHIGPKRAEKIIKRRPYRDAFELSNVLGLGKKRMTDLLFNGKFKVVV
jgi:competence protein ComEC